MIQNNNFALIDPQTGNLAFKLFRFEKNNPFDQIQRLNYYSMIWLETGSGAGKADFSEYRFGKNVLFSFSPYQPFIIDIEGEICGWVIHFHPDFSVYISTTKRWRATAYCLIIFTIRHLCISMKKLP